MSSCCCCVLPYVRQRALAAVLFGSPHPLFLNFRFWVSDSPSGTLALTRSPVFFFAEGRSRSERGTVTRRTFSAMKLSLTPRTHAHALRRGKKGRRKRYEMIVTKSRTMLDLPYDRARASCTLHTQKLEKELLLQQQQLQKKDPRIKTKRREAKLAAVAVAAADSSCSMPASDASTSPSEEENTSGADADTEESITSEEEAEKASKPSPRVPPLRPPHPASQVQRTHVRGRAQAPPRRARGQIVRLLPHSGPSPRHPLTCPKLGLRSTASARTRRPTRRSTSLTFSRRSPGRRPGARTSRLRGRSRRSASLLFLCLRRASTCASLVASAVEHPTLRFVTHFLRNSLFAPPRTDISSL